ncbi:hypothetical protein C8R45DRAFT_1079165 [Mycena sanguinolenta]|nr:hypothetical protein C8R45DRAFT_1079165 [Mycena sanguinolenta]
MGHTKPTRPATISEIALDVERTFIGLARADVGLTVETTPTHRHDAGEMADELASATCHFVGCYSETPGVRNAGFEAMKPIICRRINANVPLLDSKPPLQLLYASLLLLLVASLHREVLASLSQPQLATSNLNSSTPSPYAPSTPLLPAGAPDPLRRLAVRRDKEKSDPSRRGRRVRAYLRTVKRNRYCLNWFTLSVGSSAYDADGTTLVYYR